MAFLNAVVAPLLQPQRGRVRGGGEGVEEGQRSDGEGRATTTTQEGKSGEKDEKSVKQDKLHHGMRGDEGGFEFSARVALEALETEIDSLEAQAEEQYRVFGQAEKRGRDVNGGGGDNKLEGSMENDNMITRGVNDGKKTTEDPPSSCPLYQRQTLSLVSARARDLDTAANKLTARVVGGGGDKIFQLSFHIYILARYRRLLRLWEDMHRSLEEGDSDEGEGGDRDEDDEDDDNDDDDNDDDNDDNDDDTRNITLASLRSILLLPSSATNDLLLAFLSDLTVLHACSLEVATICYQYPTTAGLASRHSLARRARKAAMKFQSLKERVLGILEGRFIKLLRPLCLKNAASWEGEEGKRRAVDGKRDNDNHEEPVKQGENEGLKKHKGISVTEREKLNEARHLLPALFISSRPHKVLHGLPIYVPRHASSLSHSSSSHYSSSSSLSSYSSPRRPPPPLLLLLLLHLHLHQYGGMACGVGGRKTHTRQKNQEPSLFSANAFRHRIFLSVEFPPLLMITTLLTEEQMVMRRVRAEINILQPMYPTTADLVHGTSVIYSI